MKKILAALLLTISVSVFAVDKVSATKQDGFPAPLHSLCDGYSLNSSNSVFTDRLLLAGGDVGQCMGACASEQGICIGQCQGDGQCISYCASAYGRCVAMCN